MTDTLINKYRPATLEEVVGQPEIVKSLSKVVETRSSHSFLFVGPSGCGKTTLARITARLVGCAPQDILEVDAATYTGIDDVRSITSALAYRPIGGAKAKAMIIDEVHALSKNAFQALLKIVEEPPSWAYWFLCTTDEGRIPKTIITRCVRYEVKPVPYGILRDYLEIIAQAEGANLDGGILEICARQAFGSPRQGLVNLAMCIDAGSRQEAVRLLGSITEGSETIELAQALMKGASWPEICRIIKGLEDEDPESVRHIVFDYFGKVVRGQTVDDKVGRALQIMDAFSQPFARGDGLNPLLLACGRARFG